MVLEKVFLRKVYIYRIICLFCSWYSKIAKIDAYVTCHFQEILKENMSSLNLYIPPSGWRCSIELQRDKIGKNWHWKRRLYSCFMSFPFCISKETAKKSFNTKDVIFKGKCRYKEFTLSLHYQRCMQRFLKVNMAMYLYISNHRNQQILFLLIFTIYSKFYKKKECDHKIKINIGHLFPYYHHEWEEIISNLLNFSSFFRLIIFLCCCRKIWNKGPHVLWS